MLRRNKYKYQKHKSKKYPIKTSTKIVEISNVLKINLPKSRPREPKEAPTWQSYTLLTGAFAMPLFLLDARNFFFGLFFRGFFMTYLESLIFSKTRVGDGIKSPSSAASRRCIECAPPHIHNEPSFCTAAISLLPADI